MLRATFDSQLITFAPLFFYILIFLLTNVTMLIINIKIRRSQSKSQLLIFGTLFLIVLIYYIWVASIGRGAEYKWNGKFFYEINKPI